MIYRNRLRFFVIAVAAFSFWGLSVDAHAAGAVFFEISGVNSLSNAYGGNSGTVVIKISQKYVASSDQKLCRVYHKITKLNSSSNSIVLRISQGGTNGDGGSQITSVSVLDTALPTNIINYTEFALPNCINLTAGTTYWFTFEPSSPTTFGNYRSAYRNSNEFNHSSMWEKNGFAFDKIGWQENLNAEWSLKLEGSENPRPEPVIIIPGILGTELSNGDDLLWPDLTQMLGDIGDEFLLTGLAMTSDGESVNNINANKVSEIFLKNVPGFRIDIFQGLRISLEQNDYAIGSNLFFFPYDWRLDLDKTKDLLKNKIDEVKSLTGFTKVNIIAHSMGGLLVKDYINQYGKNDIDKLIFVGTPHLGAPKTAKVLLEGDRFDIPWLAPSAIKALSLNTSTIYELLPSQTYFSQFTGYLKKHDSNDPLDYSNTKRFLIGKGVNWNLFDKAETLFNKNLQDISLSGVDAYNIAGCKTGTQAGYQYNSDDSEIAGIKYTSGDGTVPLPSADYLNIPSGHKYYFKNGEHAELSSAEAIRNLIINLLKGQTTMLPSNLAQGDNSLCNFKGKELLWRSPVEIHVYDQFGNHTGPIDNNAIEYGVPGLDYEIIGHRKFVFLPTDSGQTYTVVTKGLGNDSFDLLVSENQNGNITKTTVFNDVDITPLSIANLEISDQSQDNSINLDKNGTGQFQTVAASTVLFAGQEADVMPPSTTIVFSGAQGNANWYKSEVAVMLNSSDDLSGILETKYSLDDGEFQSYNEPFAIKAEGTHLVRYYSIDRTGNNELVQVAEIRIDKTAPEISILFNLETKDFQFTGVDAQDINPRVICLDAVCTATDQAGNTTSLKFEYADKKNHDELYLKSISYQQQPSIILIKNNFKVKLETTDNFIRNFTQTINIKGQERAKIEYRQKDNQSKIELKTTGGKKTKQIIDGVVLLNLSTQKGILDISIK